MQDKKKETMLHAGTGVDIRSQGCLFNHSVGQWKFVQFGSVRRTAVVSVSLSETASHYAAQADLKLTLLLLRPPEWRCVSPQPALEQCFEAKVSHTCRKNSVCSRLPP